MAVRGLPQCQRQRAWRADWDNRKVGTAVFDSYPTYEEWIGQFDMDSDVPDMKKLEPHHFDKLPVWSEGNFYLNGAEAWKHEKKGCIPDASMLPEAPYADVEERDGSVILRTNIGEWLRQSGFTDAVVDSDTLGKAFEPEERFENPDGSRIVFQEDYFGAHRGAAPLPGRSRRMPTAGPCTSGERCKNRFSRAVCRQQEDKRRETIQRDKTENTRRTESIRMIMR